MTESLRAKGDGRLKNGGKLEKMLKKKEERGKKGVRGKMFVVPQYVQRLPFVVFLFRSLCETFSIIHDVICYYLKLIRQRKVELSIRNGAVITLKEHMNMKFRANGTLF